MTPGSTLSIVPAQDLVLPGLSGRYLDAILSAGLHDSRVSYWEPAKWISKARRASTGHPVILLLTQMEAGHAGVSGVYSQLREIALEQAFLLRATCVVAEMPTLVCLITSGNLPMLYLGHDELACRLGG